MLIPELMARSRSVTLEAGDVEPSLLLEGQMHDDSRPFASDSPHGSETNDNQSQQSTHGSSESAAQKRRRVTRACDECRRKKIKCDGRQPCTHCTVYSYDCTYDQPSNRRRNPPPQYIEALETRLARTEAVLKHFLPQSSLDDEALDTFLRESGQSGAGSSLSVKGSRSQKKPNLVSHPSNDAKLESMVDSTGQLDIDESGNPNYVGHSSNLIFLRRMREQLGDLDGPEQFQDENVPLRQPRKTLAGGPLPDPSSPSELLSNNMEYPFGTSDNIEELPSKDLALALCNAALDDACAILSIIHHPTFYFRFERIYGLRQSQYEDQDHKFLPLLYVVFSLGCLFAKDEHSELYRKGYKSATGEGYKYFWTARQLMDITDCRDITSLQAIVFMIMFLQCSAKLATCYAYIGVALRSAMRMGLHRNFRDSFSPIEAECRKRVFWTIRKMDIYVGATLGLPQTLSGDDIDQEYPTPVHDEFITKEQMLLQPSDSVPPMAAANANFKLCAILIKIMRTIYPIKNFQTSEQNSSRSYSVSYKGIKEIELELQGWMEDLPSQLVPRDMVQGGGDIKLVRMQQLLRVAYAHAQLLLYRPFLHYVSSKHHMASVNQRSYACANACVSVSRNIIHITSEMRRQGLLQGSYWFTMYTTFFAILTLVFFALENPQSANEAEIVADAKQGKETLAILAKRSMAADRCTSTLTVLFKQLGPSLERLQPASSGTAGRKREASLSEADGSSLRSQSAKIPDGTSQGRVPKGKKGAAAGIRGGGSVRLPSRSERSSTQPDYSRPASMGAMGQVSSGQSPATPASSSSSYGPRHPSQIRQIYAQQQQQHHMQPPLQAQQHQQMPYLPTQYQNHVSQDQLSDMAAVMFPSDNPFAYPKQPMNTLEQNYAFAGLPGQDFQNSPAHAGTGPGQDMFLPASTSGAETVSADDHIDVQLFGPLPPYMSNQGMNIPSSPWGQHVEGNIADINNMQRGGAPDMWNHQQDMNGPMSMDLGDIFTGEDWDGNEGNN